MERPTGERCVWSGCPHGGVISVGQRVSTDDQGIVLHLECREALYYRQKEQEEMMKSYTNDLGETITIGRVGNVLHVTVEGGLALAEYAASVAAPLLTRLGYGSAELQGQAIIKEDEDRVRLTYRVR